MQTKLVNICTALNMISCDFHSNEKSFNSKTSRHEMYIFLILWAVLVMFSC